MERERMLLRCFAEEVDLLTKLVSDELDRRCQAVDEIINRVYDVLPARHTEKAIAEVKAAVLELVRSPLADLERKLAGVDVEPEVKPAEAVKPAEEVVPVEEAEAVAAEEKAPGAAGQPKG